ncbi:outer membrane beta-barrel protein [Pseudaminobacter soli (ex Li et al. 2025)]|uniref:Outer membrane protein beta-barrel domain-containing protein n=1 Tax=Pseudaminobacter soli (ex Li et al. 2025) TaxID=1295366 RepID=A0A2P7RMF1_9HYPH|nr:outer membrane beta-barrel protein [Mesorhizobium soli]PSJ51392.1 hypothetical protein C7I85_29630 [Mesorhizobium soli]
MKSYIIASALLVASITGAQAADVVVQEPVAAYNWSGVYVGANIGWSGLKSDWHDIDDDWTGGSFKAGSDGILLGGVLGYNVQLANNVVLGIEGDLAYTSNKRSFDAPDSLVNKMDMFGTVRGRVCSTSVNA